MGKVKANAVLLKSSSSFESELDVLWGDLGPRAKPENGSSYVGELLLARTIRETLTLAPRPFDSQTAVVKEETLFPQKSGLGILDVLANC